MKKQHDHIDDLFREELSGYTETPPPAVWDALEKRLDTLPPAKTRFPNGNIWQFIVPSMLVVVSASIAISIYNKTFQDKISATRNGAEGPAQIAQNVPANNNITGNNNTVTNHVNTNNNNPLSPDKTQTQKSNTYSFTGNSNHHPSQNGNHSVNLSYNKTSTTKFTNENQPNEDQPNHSSKSPKKRNNALTAFASAVHSNPAMFSLLSGVNSAQNTVTGNVNASPLNLSDAAVVNESLPASNPAQQPITNMPAKADSVTTVLPHKQAAKPAAPKKQDLPAPKMPEYFAHYEAGLKGGYEFGTNRDAAHKIVASAYLQYNFNSTLGVMIQPAVKLAELQDRYVSGSLNYYSILPGTSTITPGGISYSYIEQPNGNATDTFVNRSYRYSQKYDSIVKRYAVSPAYAEFELPILLKLKLTSKLSCYGGVNIQCSRDMTITEKSQNNIMTKTGSNTTSTLIDYAAPAPKSIDSVITYSGNPISTYKEPLYSTPNGYNFRVGYMLGVSYKIKPRWMVDGLLQQSNAPVNNVGGYNINSALSSAYLRFTLGYSLTK